MVNFNIQITPDDIKRFFNKKITILSIIALCILGVFFVYIHLTNVWADTEVKKTEVEKIKKDISNNEIVENVQQSETILGTSDCISQDFETFETANWSGKSWFSVSEGVWTIPYSIVQKDAVIFYKTNCSGSSLVQFHTTPRLEDFINLNVYLRGQLRWEIGGRDRRSIRLWKNTIGCQSGEIKGAELLLNMYLPNHDEILIDQPLIINMATYFLKNGKIRNELWLTYSSKKSLGEEITTPRNSYFYDFEAGSVCDVDHLPSINIEPYQFGLGLQQINTKTELESPKLPKVSFDKFKISPFLIEE